MPVDAECYLFTFPKRVNYAGTCYHITISAFHDNVSFAGGET